MAAAEEERWSDFQVRQLSGVGSTWGVDVWSMEKRRANFFWFFCNYLHVIIKPSFSHLSFIYLFDLFLINIDMNIFI